MTSANTWGLLLDVDGPVASPESRTVRPEIIENLVRLAVAGWPVAFNTGRSVDFIVDQVMNPMIAAGLPADVRVLAVCEKGGVWFTFTGDGPDQPQVDPGHRLPGEFAADVRALVAERFADRMFFDETKLAMLSVEQRVDVANADYMAVQEDFELAVLGLAARRGLGIRRLGQVLPAVDGSVPYRVDPTIISTDIEAVEAGKDLGVRRVLELLEQAGEPAPAVWRTIGDSRTDYAMADELHARGFDVAHVDVRPADGVPAVPYPVLTAAELVHDDAGAVFIARWAAVASGEAADDAGLGPLGAAPEALETAETGRHSNS
ncbi:hypothetical protein BN1051_00185 [Arthrobacter saudimassiliensis]|uniref:Uncharacterized protein n=1 Tax=Arthrobacter saudimassiliensis TaxID=1461584 RepID=A0A078MPV3_9MICC|nr:hypothetical protein BN1051_00185 [Arthrobacter saudimassiliensis]